MRGKLTLAIVLAAAALSGCAGKNYTGSAVNLVDQMGGMDKLNTVAGDFLKGAQKDPRLSSLMSSVDVDKVTPQLTNQLCSALGGSCKAPLSSDQVKAGAAKLTPQQQSAVGEQFGSALDKAGVNSASKTAITSALGSQLSGILGGLI